MSDLFERLRIIEIPFTVVAPQHEKRAVAVLGIGPRVFVFNARAGVAVSGFVGDPHERAAEFLIDEWLSLGRRGLSSGSGNAC